MIPHLTKRFLDSQLREKKWPSSHIEYLLRPHWYANARLLLFSLAVTISDRNKGTFLLKRHRGGSQKTRDPAPESNIQFQCPLTSSF